MRINDTENCETISQSWTQKKVKPLHKNDYNKNQDKQMNKILSKSNNPTQDKGNPNKKKCKENESKDLNNGLQFKNKVKLLQCLRGGEYSVTIAEENAIESSISMQKCKTDMTLSNKLPKMHKRRFQIEDINYVYQVI